MPRILIRTLLGLLAAALLLGAVLAAEIQHARTRDRLPTDPGFDVDVIAGRDRPGERLEVAVLGDSLVAGVGASSAEASLGGQLADKLARALDRPVRVVGHGVSGAITSEVVDQLDEVEDGVDVIVLETGSNDVTHRTSLDELERSTEQLLRGAQDRAPIVVFGSAGELDAPLFKQPLRKLITLRATQVRDRQAEVAKRFDVPFMNVKEDVSPAYQDAHPESSSSDLFHPSDTGYEIWARPLAKLVAREVGERTR